MADKPKPTTAAKPEPPALPDLDAIESVEVASLPETTKAPALSEQESAFAAAIIERGSDGKYAVGPKLADRKEATAAAARVRRLVNRYIAAQGTAKAERPTLATRIVPKDGGQAWAITIVPPSAPEPDDTSDGNAITESAASS